MPHLALAGSLAPLDRCRGFANAKLLAQRLRWMLSVIKSSEAAANAALR